MQPDEREEMEDADGEEGEEEEEKEFEDREREAVTEFRLRLWIGKLLTGSSSSSSSQPSLKVDHTFVTLVSSESADLWGKYIFSVSSSLPFPFCFPPLLLTAPL